MHLTPDTFRALNIFEDEMHPNSHSQRSKEGLSLFGILNKARTYTHLIADRWAKS
jgi:DNA mismatch repair protein MSH5